jgi:hypothetical protein
VIQTIRKPTPVTSAYVLNGAVFDPESFKKK